MRRLPELSGCVQDRPLGQVQQLGGGLYDPVLRRVETVLAGVRIAHPQQQDPPIPLEPSGQLAEREWRSQILRQAVLTGSSR